MIEENERAAKFMQAIQRDGEKRRTAIIQAIDEEIAAELRIERDEALQTIVRSRQELRERFGETKQELAERYETILQKMDRYL